MLCRCGTPGRPDRALFPTIEDPALIWTTDGTMFVCWVESIGDGARWVFVSGNATRYTGPIYAGPYTLEQIRALVDEWWEGKKALGQQGVTIEKLRGLVSDGR